jgi:hypothetical protein
MLATGLLQFFADTSRYLHNGAFPFKLGCLALALLNHFTIRNPALAVSRKMPPAAAACLSLLLWSAVVLAARAIADFDA